MSERQNAACPDAIFRGRVPDYYWLFSLGVLASDCPITNMLLPGFPPLLPWSAPRHASQSTRCQYLCSNALYRDPTTDCHTRRSWRVLSKGMFKTCLRQTSTRHPYSASDDGSRLCNLSHRCLHRQLPRSTAGGRTPGHQLRRRRPGLALWGCPGAAFRGPAISSSSNSSHSRRMRCVSGKQQREHRRSRRRCSGQLRGGRPPSAKRLARCML